MPGAVTTGAPALLLEEVGLNGLAADGATGDCIGAPAQDSCEPRVGVPAVPEPVDWAKAGEALKVAAGAIRPMAWVARRASMGRRLIRNGGWTGPSSSAMP
jgi:hypothetical protein